MFVAGPIGLRMKRNALIAIAAASLLAGLAATKLTKKTVDERLTEYGPAARTRLQPHFEKAKLAYPPAKLLFVGIKDERRLELYGAGTGQPWKFLRAYPALAASGSLGPKLREGDRQVPEGIYPIELLNPNSRFHLSLREIGRAHV